MRWRLALVGLLLPLVGGCSVVGTAVISPDDIVTVEATIWETRDGQSACTGLADPLLGLSVQPLTDPASPARSGCRVRGSLHLVALAVPDLGVSLRHTGDGRYVLIAPSGLWDATKISASSPELDFRVTFPGPVIETDPAASVDGSTVSWTAPPAPGRGLEAVSLEGGQLPPLTWLALWSALALLAGVGAAIAYQAIRAAWRRRGVRPVETSEPTASDWSQDWGR